MQTIIHTSPARRPDHLHGLQRHAARRAALLAGAGRSTAAGNPLSFSDDAAGATSGRRSCRSPRPTSNADRRAASRSSRWASQAFAGALHARGLPNLDQPLATGNRVLNVTTAADGVTSPPTRCLRGSTGGGSGGSTPTAAPGRGPRTRTRSSGSSPSRATRSASSRPPTAATSPTTTRASPGRGRRGRAVPVPGRRQRRLLVTRSSRSSVTVMTSWHSTKVYPNGTYYWRVQTIDGGGNITATSDGPHLHPRAAAARRRTTTTRSRPAASSTRGRRPTSGPYSTRGGRTRPATWRSPASAASPPMPTRSRST